MSVLSGYKIVRVLVVVRLIVVSLEAIVVSALTASCSNRILVVLERTKQKY